MKSALTTPNKISQTRPSCAQVYLKIIGRIPTMDEKLRHLCLIVDLKGRKLLIDKLLNSEGYNHNWFIYWADILERRLELWVVTATMEFHL